MKWKYNILSKYDNNIEEKNGSKNILTFLKFYIFTSIKSLRNYLLAFVSFSFNFMPIVWKKQIYLVSHKKLTLLFNSPLNRRVLVANM